MIDQPLLNEHDWQLVLELLENERRDLPNEIRRTDTPRVHDDLQERMRTIDDLIERLRQAEVH